MDSCLRGLLRAAAQACAVVALTTVVTTATECRSANFSCDPSAAYNATKASWCQSSNPLIIARPPSAVSLAPTASTPYYCPSLDPFGTCALIDNFFAAEVIAYPNTPTKVIMVAQR